MKSSPVQMRSALISGMGASPRCSQKETPEWGPSTVHTGTAKSPSSTSPRKTLWAILSFFFMPAPPQNWK